MEINAGGKRGRGTLKQRWMNRTMNKGKIAGVGKGEV